MNLRFQGAEQEYLYDLFSTIKHTLFQYDIISYNHTSYTLPTSQQQLTRDFKRIFKVFLHNNQPQIITETYQNISKKTG